MLRPLPKVDLYIYFSGDVDELLAKGVNVYYNKNNDYYSIKVEDLIGKTYLPPHKAFIDNDDEHSFENMVDIVISLNRNVYFMKNGIEYNYSNIYLEKTENKINIKLIFERYAHNKFIQMQNAESVFKEICAPRYVNTRFNRQYFELQELCNENLLKSTYMNGLYMQNSDKRLYFKGGYIHENTKEELANTLLHKPLDIIVSFEERKEYSIW